LTELNISSDSNNNGQIYGLFQQAYSQDRQQRKGAKEETEEND